MKVLSIYIQHYVPKGEIPLILKLHIVVERSISELVAKNLHMKNIFHEKGTGLRK